MCVTQGFQMWIAFGMSCAGHQPPHDAYMMPQEERGLAMWQVQAD